MSPSFLDGCDLDGFGEAQAPKPSAEALMLAGSLKPPSSRLQTIPA